MAAKFFLALCASALLVNTISAQCIGYGSANRLASAEIASLGLGGCGCGGLNYGGIYGPQIASASGGGLAVASASPLSPNGVSLVSENAIEGVLEVGGQLPLLAAVAFEGQLPTAGAAGVAYSCGNGNVGIFDESLAAAGIGGGRYGTGPLGRVGYGAGLAGAEIGAAIAGAEIAGLNAGRYGAGIYGAGLAGSRFGSSCGCGGLYY